MLTLSFDHNISKVTVGFWPWVVFVYELRRSTLKGIFQMQHLADSGGCGMRILLWHGRRILRWLWFESSLMVRWFEDSVLVVVMWYEDSAVVIIVLIVDVVVLFEDSVVMYCKPCGDVVSGICGDKDCVVLWFENCVVV
jgi:hypothetical protein